MVRKAPAKRRRRYQKKKGECKNPDCNNKLTGKQRNYCCKACSQKVYRATQKTRKGRKREVV